MNNESSNRDSNIEIERKYLVSSIPDKYLVNPVKITQGYLPTTDLSTVRVRIQGDLELLSTQAFLTIKGKRKGISCPEFEYDIPVKDARELLSTLVPKTLTKTRYRFKHDKLFEVDFFHGSLEGLIIMEVELSGESEIANIPSDIDCLETSDHKFSNSNLINLNYNPIHINPGRNTVIEISDAEQFISIQKELFKTGAKWIADRGCNILRYSKDINYLRVNESGIMTWSSEPIFPNHQATLEELIEYNSSEFSTDKALK